MNTTNRASSPPQISTSSRTKRVLLLFKSFLGLALLGCLVFWISGNSDLLARTNTMLVAWSSLVAIGTLIANCVTLRVIVTAYCGTLTHHHALQLSSAGALGNALGGIPIGTSLKYVLFYKLSGLKVREITAGLVAFSIVISLWLIAFTAISAPYALSGKIAMLPAIIFFSCLTIAAMSAPWIIKHKILGPLVAPFMHPPRMGQALAAGLAVAALFVANYWVVSFFIAPEINFPTLVFIASAGILVSLGSLLQSVGGIQEIALGISSAAVGLSAQTGVELALVMRFTSVIACVVVLGILYLLPIITRR